MREVRIDDLRAPRRDADEQAFHEMALAMHGVDRHDDAFDAEVMPQHGIGLDGEQNRRGVGEASGLNKHPIKIDDLTGAPLDKKLMQGFL